ncbi:hypothetical protein BX600DRAFT_66089 [Xylariales sp. PMI_506]|nr:hypothetical protein BX600DRAFT_66089 [Xylariales sp. PMI_506]
MMSKVTEAAREREVYRYTSSLLGRSRIHDAATLSVRPTGVPYASDSVLGALAQLGALRLGAARALISFFDTKLQYIVAEVTAHGCIGHAQERAAGKGLVGDQFSLSGVAIPRARGVCERVLATEAHPSRQQFAGSGTQVSSPGHELAVTVVPDLADSASAFTSVPDCPYLTDGGSEEAIRFYTAVPIRSRRGIDIGVYCVLDPHPRSELDPTSVGFLQDISATIMTYLENVAAAQGHQRSVRMVRGMGSLVEGKGSMSRWWLGDDGASFADSVGAEGTLNSKQQTLQLLDDEYHVAARQSLSVRPARVPLPASPMTSLSAMPDGLADDLELSAEHNSKMETASASGEASASRSTTQKTDGSTVGTTSGSVTQQQDDESVAAVTALLSRAANVIRESIECEGVLFLDAAIGSFGGLVGQSGSDTPSSAESTRDSPASGNEDPKGSSTATESQLTTLCKILGYSTSSTASIDGDPAALAHLSIPESFLKRLLRRYPDGRIFNFDESGTVLSGDSSEDDGSIALLSPDSVPAAAESTARPSSTNTRRRPLRPSEEATLASTFVGARSIALVPLWDSHKERWFAGGLLWTKTPTRVFTYQGELSFLKAFGMAVMTEVARINSLQSTKAKADVLGSISHELRSPLHGISLGIELLSDTKLDTFQTDVLHTVETCGRTLVDTINHLLDYSKINRFVRLSRRRAGSRSRGIHQSGSNMVEAGMTNLYSDIGLDTIVEEVVENVFAGFSYQQLSRMAEKRPARELNETIRTQTMNRYSSFGPMENPNDQAPPLIPSSSQLGVKVYIKIDPSVRWMFYTQPGAIRRIVMNLFGNALKYTSRGFIVVSLTQEATPGSKRSGRQNVTISISDSGKGIGVDYLKNQLFTPFAQEDHLATGVGLGLSLVKQITSTLGGKITLESQVRRGTTVRVSIPLRRSGRNLPPTPSETDFAACVAHLQGLSIGLIGFDKDSNTDNPLVSNTNVVAPASAQDTAHKTIEEVCRGWLHMDVIPESNTTVEPSIYICTEDAIDRVPPPATASSRSTPVVVVCHDMSTAHQLSLARQAAVGNHIYEYISQPAGARKLARVLSNTLKRWKESTTLEQETVDAPTSNNIQPSAPERSNSDSSGDGLSSATSESANSRHDPEVEAKPVFLLVDDNNINLKILSAYMKKSNRLFATAEDGLVALDTYRQHPEKHRCILMDISMPVMDGMESTRLIREFEQQHKLAPALIIALSGLATAGAQQDALASGIDIFMSRPVYFAEIEKILKTKGL